MKSLLIFGGTKYLGKELIYKLRDEFEIVIFSRKKISNCENLKSFIVDRDDKESIKKNIKKEFDYVIDFINYSSFHSSLIHELVLEEKLKCKFYMMISSTWIYYDNNNGIVTEKNFNPNSYKYEISKSSFSYEESKRLSESFIVQNFRIPYAIVRFPIILASDDYTKRFEFIPRHITNNQFQQKSCNKKFQVVFKQDAVNFLYNLIKVEKTGIFHFSGKEILTEKILWDYFQDIIKNRKIKKLIIKDSPFNFPSDLILDCSKAYKIYKPKNTFELLNKEYKKLGIL